MHEGLFEPERLRAVAGNDPSFLRELAEEFARSAARTRADLTAALGAEDLGALADVAHRFKSASGQVGAHEVEARCAALERLARGDAVDAAAVRAQVRELLPMMVALEAGLAVVAAEADSGK